MFYVHYACRDVFQSDMSSGQDEYAVDAWQLGVIAFYMLTGRGALLFKEVIRQKTAGNCCVRNAIQIFGEMSASLLGSCFQKEQHDDTVKLGTTETERQCVVVDHCRHRCRRCKFQGVDELRGSYENTSSKAHFCGRLHAQ